MSLTGGIDLAPLVVKIKADVAGFKTDMEAAKVAGVTQANQISKTLNETAKVGKTLDSIGTTLTRNVSVPLALVAAGSVSMALEFGNSFAKVSTLLDEGVVNFADYKDAIIDGSNKSKVAVDQYSEAVYESISAGVDQTKAVGFTTKAMDLARGGFTTGALAVDVMTTAINGYKLKTEDATKVSDMLIETQNLGKTTVDELAQSMGKVIPIASSVNFGMNELSASYAVLTFNGIATAEAGTYMKQMLSELGTTGSKTDEALKELSGKGFAQLKAEGVPTADVLKMLGKYASDSGLTLKDLFGSVEAGTAALVLASQDGAQYNDFLAKINGSAGATQAAIDKLNADPLEQLKGSMNELKNAGIILGAEMTPAIGAVTAAVSGLAGAFSEMDDAQQTALVNTGLFLIALGLVTKLVGGAATTLPKIAKVIGGLSGTIGGLGTTLIGTEAATAGGTAAMADFIVAADGTAYATGGAATAVGSSGLAGTLSGILGPSLATATVAVGAFGILAAGVGVAVTEAYTQMTAEVVPEVDIFTSKLDEANQKITANTGNTATSMQMVTGTYKETAVEISDATKKAVTAYMELDEGAYKSMMSLYLNGTTITQDIANDMTSKYAAMGQTINASLEADYTQRLTTMQGFFNQSSTLTEAEETQILSNLNTNYEEQKTANASYQSQISAIYQAAADAHRSITTSEQQEINTLQGVMKINAINTLSETEAESAVILGRIKDQDGRMTVEMASEHVKALEDQRVKTVDQANQECAQKVAVIEQMRDELGVISAGQAATMIADAEKQRDGTITAAQATKDQGISVLEGAYDGLGNTVDKNTGEILGNVERAKNAWNNWIINDKNATVRDNTKEFQGAVQWTKDWWSSLEFETKYAVIETVNSMTDVNANMDSSIRDSTSYNYNGLNYVPYDGFKSTLHKGERVLTEKENRDYTQGDTGSGGLNQLVVQSMLDGRVIAEAIIDDVDLLAGRKVGMKARGMA